MYPRPGLAWAICFQSSSSQYRSSVYSAEYSNMPMVSSWPVSAASLSWLRTTDSSSPALDMHQIWLLGRAMVVLDTAAQGFQSRISRSSSMLTSSLLPPRPARRFEALILYREPLASRKYSCPFVLPRVPILRAGSNSTQSAGSSSMVSWHICHCSLARSSSWATPRTRSFGNMNMRHSVIVRFRSDLPFCRATMTRMLPNR